MQIFSQREIYISESGSRGLNFLGQHYAANALVKFAKDILAGLKYYRRKGVDGNSEIYTYPGAWREVISTYESANAGPRWETADEMLLNITSYTSKYMKLTLQRCTKGT